MLLNDQHVFDTNETAKVHHVTSYEHTFFLVKDFFQEYKKEILESRINGNISIIWNKVGKENFERLNNLFRVFQENFSGFKIYGLLEAIRNNENNEQTRLYYELIRQRDEILEDMRRYSLNQERKK